MAQRNQMSTLPVTLSRPAASIWASISASVIANADDEENSANKGISISTVTIFVFLFVFEPPVRLKVG